MNKHEQKYANTNTKICNAFLQLLEAEDYNKITISAICKQAQINRTTFYLLFQNISEILDIINSGLLEKFLRENKIDYTQTVDPYSFPLSPYLIIARQDLLKLLTFIKSHVRLYSIIVKNRDLLRLGLPETDIKNNVFIPSVSNLQPLNKDVLEYVFDFYVAGTQKILTKWILSGCAEDETDIIKIIDLCLYKQTMS